MQDNTNLPPNPSLFDRLNQWAGQSVMLKMATIALLALILLIPLFRIQALVGERQNRRAEVIEEVSKSWAGEQGIAAPALVIPYTHKVPNADKSGYIEVIDELIVLPEELNITGDLSPDNRNRGLFDIIVYSANLAFEGNFVIPDVAREVGTTDELVHWENAFLTLSLTDKRGITSAPTIDWQGEKVSFGPGDNYLVGSEMTLPYPAGVNPYTRYFEKSTAASSGLKALANLNGQPISPIKFQLAMSLHGTGSLAFLPLGKETTVKLSSPWPSPSFAGAYLPVTHDTNEDGFNAKWAVSYLNRGFPQHSTDMIHKYSLEQALLGVRLVEPVNSYVQTERSVKYGMLVIVLTFISFFLTEVISKRRIHPFQYILVGGALVVFYTLLLSISEHVSFEWAYLTSALATIGLVTFYISAVLRSAKLTATQAAGLVIIYGFIFIILRLEDYSLLAGSIGLFILISLLMVLTRRVNWYQNDGAIQSASV